MKVSTFHFTALILLLFYGSNHFLYSQWTQVAQLSNLGVYPKISVVDSNVVWIAGSGTSHRIYRTVNGGSNWTQIPTGTLPFYLTGVAAKDSLTAFVSDAGSFNGAGGNANFFKTTNAGINWILIDTSGGPNGSFDGIIFSKSQPQVGILLSDPPAGAGNPYLLLKTTNGGNNWTRTVAPGVVSNFGLFYTTFLIDAQFYGFMTLNPSNFFSNSYITSNGGSSWNLGDVPIAFGTSGGDLVFHDNKLNGIMISGGTIPNIKRTTNGGVNWVTINTMTDLLGFVTASWISGTNTVFIVSNNSLSERCVIRSDDAGLTWTSQNTASVIGLREMDYQRYDNRIIAYTISAVGNVLKSSQIVQPVGIQQIGTAIPLNYSLLQNYPNPFNPTTKINFNIPESGLVSLKIFDVNGKEVRTLVNVVKAAGYYSLELNASDISSGIYFYRFQAGGFVHTKKMLLVK